MSDSKLEPSAAEPSVHAGGFDEKTFLTSINDPGTMAVDLPDPEGLQRVKHLHSQITGVVATLNDKVGKVLQKQEREFLSAYRAHMYQVQKELQSLRAKANDAELQLKKNDKIRSLEDEKEWYRKEALRLDKFSTQLKAELKFMREKLEAIEEDRNWLERQLKTSKKSNKLLRADLEVRMQTEAGSPSSVDGDRPGGIWGEETGGSATGGGGTGMFPPPGRPSSRTREVAPPARRLTGGGSSRSDDGRTQAALAMVEKLQAELAAERQTTKALRAATVAGQSDRGEMETFFLQCVDDIRKDIARRRTRSLVASQTKARPRVGATSTAPITSGTAAFDKSFSKDKVKARAQEPSLEDYTATDRRRVVEKLLSDDYVLEALHHLIFSAPDPDASVDEGPSGGSMSEEHGVGVSVPGLMDVPEDDGDIGPTRTGVAEQLRPSRIHLESDVQEYLTGGY